MFRREQEVLQFSVCNGFSLPVAISVGASSRACSRDPHSPECINTSVLIPQHHSINGVFLPLILKNGGREIDILRSLSQLNCICYFPAESYPLLNL